MDFSTGYLKNIYDKGGVAGRLGKFQADLEYASKKKADQEEATRALNDASLKSANTTLDQYIKERMPNDYNTYLTKYKGIFDGTNGQTYGNYMGEYSKKLSDQEKKWYNDNYWGTIAGFQTAQAQWGADVEIAKKNLDRIKRDNTTNDSAVTTAADALNRAKWGELKNVELMAREKIQEENKNGVAGAAKYGEAGYDMYKDSVDEVGKRLASKRKIGQITADDIAYVAGQVETEWEDNNYQNIQRTNKVAGINENLKEGVHFRPTIRDEWAPPTAGDTVKVYATGMVQNLHPGASYGSNPNTVAENNYNNALAAQDSIKPKVV